MKIFLSLVLSFGALFGQTSTPQVKPQPSASTYGVEQLTLFNSYNRDSYLKAFGVQAPPFNPSKPVKYWFDSSAATVASYTVLDLGNPQQPVFKSISLPAEDAKSVNLPGIYVYPQYSVPSTKCSVFTPDGSESTVDPFSVATREQAEALNTELGGIGVSENTAVICPATERRRSFTINRNGLDLNVGNLLHLKNTFGVGAPGAWDLTGMEPSWNKIIPDTGATASNVARVPVRKLLANEKFLPTMFGVQIARTDVQGPANNTGSFSDADRALLHKIADKLGIK